MSKYKDLYEWLKQCPQLNDAWFLSGEYRDYSSVIAPSETANPIQGMKIEEYIDEQACVKPIPTVPYYEDYQINIHMEVVSQDNHFNMQRLDDAQAVCDWLIEQRHAGNEPSMEGIKTYAIDVLTPNPFIRGIDSEEGLIGYFVTIRVYRDNPMKPIEWYVENADS